MKLSLRLTSIVAAVVALGISDQVSAITVISNAIEDAQFLPGNEQNREELILNDTGTNPGRYGGVRFDTDILGGNGSGAPAFTDPSQFTLVSATLRLFEQNETPDRNGANGDRTGNVGAFFYNTLENSDWTIANSDSIDSNDAGAGTTGTGWFGNSSGRNGNLGGNEFQGDPRATNVDERSNGSAPLGQTSPEDNAGVALVEHTFDSTNSDETVDIDLTAGGASLSDIQSLLADWVAGNNAGIGLRAEFGDQVFFQSNGVDAGLSVESSIDDGSGTASTQFSGVSADEGLGANGPGTGTISLILEFEVFDGLRGDFNNDLVVNAADFAVWRDSVGAATDDAISGNGDGIAGVNLDDYAVWQQGFGASAAAATGGVASSTTVPEPSAAILLGLLIGGAAAGARTRV